MANAQYITIEGDRWDTIAYKAYGDALRIKELLEANKGLPIEKTLPAGIKINVPILEGESDEVSGELLPPWKR